jgi:hypothetical protein
MTLVTQLNFHVENIIFIVRKNSSLKTNHLTYMLKYWNWIPNGKSHHVAKLQSTCAKVIWVDCWGDNLKGLNQRDSWFNNMVILHCKQ